MRDRGVDFLLLAGDLYDGDWRDYNTGHFFLRQMGLLRDAGIPVYIVWGNHDAENAMTKKLSSLENMHVFFLEEGQTKRLEELNVSIHGHSYGRKDVSDDLSLSYPSPDAGCFNIGLLHTSADGRSTDTRVTPRALSRPLWTRGTAIGRLAISTNAMFSVRTAHRVPRKPSRAVLPGDRS